MSDEGCPGMSFPYAVFLMRPPALLDDAAELLELSLRAKEGPQLEVESKIEMS